MSKGTAQSRIAQASNEEKPMTGALTLREAAKRLGCSRDTIVELTRKGHLRQFNVGTRRQHEYNDRFDTPTLVEVWRTAPYLHDGRYTTIRELLVDGRHGLAPGIDFSPQQLDDLIEFVLSL